MALFLSVSVIRMSSLDFKNDFTSGPEVRGVRRKTARWSLNLILQLKVFVCGKEC